RSARSPLLAAPPTSPAYTLSLHDALPISRAPVADDAVPGAATRRARRGVRDALVGGGRDGPGRAGSADAELRGAGRPGAPALSGLDLLGDVDLLGAGGLVRGGGVRAAAEGLPGARAELQPAVVAVAGVDGPVPAGLALRDAVPHGARRCGRGRRTGVAGGLRRAALGAAVGLAAGGALLRRRGGR